MNSEWSVPPKSKAHLTSPAILIDRLKVLIGTKFPLTRKTRTDGSNLRKLIAATLEEHDLPEPSKDYAVVSEKGKGIPKITREYIDTYIVTSGNSYNLQVWNRIPTSDDIQIEYGEGTGLCANDVRFILVRVNPKSHVISSILILTPDYIESVFGKFGAPTIKHQILITHSKRREILNQNLPMIFSSDTAKVKALCATGDIKPVKPFNQWPEKGEIIPLERIRDQVAIPLLGTRIDSGETKNRGQALEQIILQKLGYSLDSGLLEGQYPDIKNQLLEIKIQDSPTVDLGQYTPEEDVVINSALGISTKDVRYLIVLMDMSTNMVQGIVLMPGSELGQHLKYVDGVSGKCQRSIKMSVFDKFEGIVVFNPQNNPPKS